MHPACLHHSGVWALPCAGMLIPDNDTVTQPQQEKAPEAQCDASG